MSNEYHSYIDPTGTEYLLHAPGVRTVFQSPEGTGMPPIQYLTQRGPLQHGVSLKGFFLQPRIVQMLIRYDYCNRDDYWRGRGGLLDALRPNRQGLNSTTTGRLRAILSTGDIRDLNVLVEAGPTFAPHGLGTWDEFAFTDTIRFIGFDPLYFNPSQQSCTFSDSSQDQLVFPITFPITFSPIVFTSNCAANAARNSGTWFTFPTIIITGPITGPRITNTSIDEFIALDYTLLAGESITIDLAYGQKTVTKNDGSNLIGFVTADSSLGTFRLETHPTVLNGDNIISVFGSGISINTSFVLSWYNRYVGLGA